ncbi:MAG TPA: zf-HC2 domain-containing protein [Thermodesulfobacteriota bacterium]|nr:zf-HC2 domain-containing protein [Thermodesulfobacteriota bacterium]
MSLRCEEVRERLSALWENELSPSEQTEVKNHLELCPDCEKEYSRFDKTLRMLHSVEEQEVPGGFLPEIYEKIGAQGGKGIPPEKASWGWLHLPLRLKLPMQALAMVAIVFLALYLTKMTPSELTRTKEIGESTPSSLEEKRAPTEFKTQGTEEKKLDRVPAPEQAEKIVEREVSGRLKKEVQAEIAAPGSNIVAGEAARQRSSKEDAALQPTTEEKKSGSILAHKPESPSPAPLKMKRMEDAAVKGTTFAELKPSEEIVLRSSDPKKTTSELEELVKKFGGEMLNAEGNMLLISLPSPVLQEFRKELEKARLPEEEQQVTLPGKPSGGAVSDVGGKRKEAEEKDKKLNQLGAETEPRAIIRIVLVKE